MARRIARAALARRIAAHSVVVVEALGADFFAAGHLPTAANVPHSAPDRLVAALVERAGHRPIVVYGTRSGGEATELAARIEATGHTEVMVYDGGKEGWVEAGLALDRPVAT